MWNASGLAANHLGTAAPTAAPTPGTPDTAVEQTLKKPKREELPTCSRRMWTSMRRCMVLTKVLLSNVRAIVREGETENEREKKRERERMSE